jgi:hypothetical protein
MTTIDEIYAAINPMPAMLSAKGKAGPSVRLQIEANARISLLFSWMKSGSSKSWECDYECFISDTVDDAIAKAAAFINALPDAKTARLHDFMGQLGKVIDCGRDLGIDIDYLNPLTDTMKRLSDNIITHQPAEAAA